MAEKEFKPTEDALKAGEKEGLLQLSEGKIKYLHLGKSYKITDPEEPIRAGFYLELIKKYQYPKERIGLEVTVPRRKPEDRADIVVYEDDNKKKPYIVVECKKDGISHAEIRQADEQAIGNANSLRAKFSLLIAGNIRIARDIAGYPQQEREKNKIADVPMRYGKVVKYIYKKGGPSGGDDPSKELKEVNRDELLAKFQQCHDTLWEGGKRNPAEAFDEMSKIMYCKIQDERFLTKKGGYYRFQVGTNETINEVAERIKNIYEDSQDIDPEVFVESIKTDNPVIYTVAEILQGISLARTDLDVKGEGYEHFLGGVFRGAMGQYFTPRPIVTFMVDFLEPNINDIVIDPACGSGGFLIYTLEKMRKELYAKLDEKDAAYRWQDFALKQVYGIEINSQLARVSMMNMIIHEDGHTNIENNDALDNPDKWKRQKIREYLGKKFSLLLTNPPFGADVKEREKPYLINYELGGKIKKRNRQKTEILFIERCLEFLKPGGRMGIVLPDGILTNSSLQYVRDFITERSQILGVVSLPQSAFRRPSSKGSGDTGSGVKASLLFLRKKEEGEKLDDNYPIFMSIAEHIGYDATGRPDKDEFPDILKAWQEFKNANKIDFFVKAPLCFKVERGKLMERIDPYYNSPKFEKTIRTYQSIKQVEFEKLIDVITKGETPLWRGDYYLHEGVPFLRAQNISEEEILGKIFYISNEVHQRMKRSQLKGGELLYTMAGTIGIAAIFPENFGISNINQAIAKIILKKGVNSRYIKFALNSNFCKTQAERFLTIAAQPNINFKQIKSIKILLPAYEIQEKIVDMMEEAYKIKKEKVAEAKKILNSIDDYVLNDLGIKLPQIKEEKNFSITFDKIRGKRFDPYSHQPKVEKIYNALSKGTYELNSIGELITDISGGATPKAKGDSYTGPDGIPFLRIQNVKADGISFEEMNYINERTHNGLLRRSQLKSGDVVFTITGRIGTVAVIPEYWKEGNINQHIVRLRLKEDILPYYFAAFFNTDFGNQQALSLTSGGSRIALDYKAIRSLKIPLPPIYVQKKIAHEIKSRREKANQLKKEAEKIIEKTKMEIEKIILGAE